MEPGKNEWGQGPFFTNSGVRPDISAIVRRCVRPMAWALPLRADKVIE